MPYGNSLEGNASFFFFSACSIVTDCSWQLRFDKKQKSCIKSIHLVTEDCSYDRNILYKVKIVFIYCSKRKLPQRAQFLELIVIRVGTQIQNY